MRYKLSRALFYLGMAVLFIGNLFSLQHWEGGHTTILVGNILEGIFSIFALIEIISSQKASAVQKVIWGLVMFVGLCACFFRGLIPLFAILLCGRQYLNTGRKYFLIPKKKYGGIEFDSI